jgi:hypothetical protein
MKKISLLALLIFFLLAHLAYLQVNLDEYFERCRNAATKLQIELELALTCATAEGGPVAGIEVCNYMAPEIAKKISMEENLTIYRVSLKTRNKDNNPDKWEKRVLNLFEEWKNKGKDIQHLEAYNIESNNLRYMKAIVIQKKCLTCHGKVDAIPVEVKETIDTLYPEDEATGYKEGDIRGAFSVNIPLER